MNQDQHVKRYEHEKLFEPDPDDLEKQAHWGDYINKAKKENNDRTTNKSDHKQWGQE